MHYLIDGYNLIFSISSKSIDLEESRLDILNVLKTSFINSRQEITIIFDGKGPEISYESFNPIKVIFTPQKMSADEYILEIISISSNPSQITVVSSDKKLTKKCSYFGARIMNNQKFIDWLNNKAIKKSKIEKNISFQDSNKNIKRLQKIFEKKFKES